MKLRNKKTGEIVNFLTIDAKCYETLEKFNEEWEDYKPAKPLIKNAGMIKLYGRIEDVKVKGGTVRGTHGYISDKVLNKVNVSEMARRFN